MSEKTIDEQEIRAKVVEEFAEKIALEISESIIWDMLATANKNSSLSDTSDKIEICRWKEKHHEPSKEKEIT